MCRTVRNNPRCFRKECRSFYIFFLGNQSCFLLCERLARCGRWFYPHAGQQAVMVIACPLFFSVDSSIGSGRPESVPRRAVPHFLHTSSSREAFGLSFCRSVSPSPSSLCSDKSLMIFSFVKVLYGMPHDCGAMSCALFHSIFHTKNQAPRVGKIKQEVCHCGRPLYLCSTYFSPDVG